MIILLNLYVAFVKFEFSSISYIALHCSFLRCAHALGVAAINWGDT